MVAFEVALDPSRLAPLWHYPTLLAVGGLGGAAGAGVASSRSIRGRAADLLLFAVPAVVTASALVVATVSMRDHPLASGGCLDNTRFAASKIYAENGVTTIIGANGSELRLAKTEPGSLSLFSAQFWSLGPVPHDDFTRVVLEGLGCG